MYLTLPATVAPDNPDPLPRNRFILWRRRAGTKRTTTYTHPAPLRRLARRDVAVHDERGGVLLARPTRRWQQPPQPRSHIPQPLTTCAIRLPDVTVRRRHPHPPPPSGHPDLPITVHLVANRFHPGAVGRGPGRNTSGCARSSGSRPGGPGGRVNINRGDRVGCGPCCLPPGWESVFKGAA
jgi:hypothetical protein